MRKKGLVLMLVVAGALSSSGLFSMEQDPAGPQGTTTVTTTRTVPQGERPALAKAPGWEWLVWPQELKIGRAFWSFEPGGTEERLFTGYSVIDAEGGALRLFFVQTGTNATDSHSFRLVVFEKSGARHLTRRSDTGESQSGKLYLNSAIFTLDPRELAPGKAAYIGVERRTRAAP